MRQGAAPGQPPCVAVVLLADFVGRAVAPKAIGQPSVKER
jgi:hypothetical protein